MIHSIYSMYCMDMRSDVAPIGLVQENFLYQHLSEVTKVRGTDVSSKLDLVFTYSSLEIENITYGPLLGKSDCLVLNMDYAVQEEVLRDITLKDS